MKEVYVCIHCLIAYEDYTEKCVYCGKPTTKATKVTKNTITFKGES